MTRSKNFSKVHYCKSNTKSTLSNGFEIIPEFNYYTFRDIEYNVVYIINMNDYVGLTCTIAEAKKYFFLDPDHIDSSFGFNIIETTFKKDDLTELNQEMQINDKIDQPL